MTRIVYELYFAKMAVQTVQYKNMQVQNVQIKVQVIRRQNPMLVIGNNGLHCRYLMHNESCYMSVCK